MDEKRSTVGKFDVDAKKRRCKIRLDDREFILDADGVSLFIAKLCDMRGAMQPPVPEDPDPSTTPKPCGTTKVIVKRDENDQVVMLGIRHHAMGWIAWVFEDPDALRLAEMLRAQARRQSSLPH